MSTYIASYILYRIPYVMEFSFIGAGMNMSAWG